MGVFSKYFLGRGVSIYLESANSAKFVAYSSTNALFNIPLAVAVGIGFTYIPMDTPLKIGFAGALAVTYNCVSRIRYAHVTPEQALQLKEMHAEWLEGGTAPDCSIVQTGFSVDVVPN